MTVGCVVLSAGRRPQELRRALASLLAQEGVEADVVVVGNGWAPTGLPDGVGAVTLTDAVTVPAGRNAGVPHVRGEVVFFLDDDASLAAPGALAQIAAHFAADPELGALQPRVESLQGEPPLREWVPRLRVGDRERSSDVTAVWEGAVAFRRSVFEAVGGWPEEFPIVHEGVDLAWRILDAGYRVRYAGDVVARHPAPARGAPAVRHDYSLYQGARNRVLLARRHLPLPLGALYVATFAARTLPRVRSAHHVRATLRGYRDGLHAPAGRRRTLRPRTLWRMTRAGRPPIL